MNQGRNAAKLLFACLAWVVTGCDDQESGAHREDSSAEKSAEKSAEEIRVRPTFSVNKKTEGALYTWVDAQGHFQITEDPVSIPKESRATVRVVVDGHSPGGEEHVFVADLTDVESGKNLPLRALARDAWETLGRGKREAEIQKLAPPPQKDVPQPSDLGVDAIVYGADWCKPCHLAEDYLKSVGARVIKKDIEEDPGAASEMRAKLQKAGLSGSSIPVLDVGGTILKGFSQSAVDAALARVKK